MNKTLIYIAMTSGAILFFFVFKLILQLVFGHYFEFFLKNYWIFVGLGLIPAFIAKEKGYPFFLFWFIGTWTPLLSIIFLLWLEEENGISNNSQQRQAVSEEEPSEIVSCFKGKIINREGNPIEGATIKVEEQATECLSDSYGNFSLELKTPESTGLVYWIKITKAGYQNLFYHYTATTDEQISFVI